VEYQLNKSILFHQVNFSAPAKYMVLVAIAIEKIVVILTLRNQPLFRRATLTDRQRGRRNYIKETRS
jgi:hypothetical protein